MFRGRIGRLSALLEGVEGFVRTARPRTWSGGLVGRSIMSIAEAFPDEPWIYELVLPPLVQSQLVWHYTDGAGLLGILQDGALRATSVLMLNDSVEFRHGADLIAQRWPEVANGYAHGVHIGHLLHTAAAVLPMQDLFVVCASTEGNSLSQFRAYGSYAIGLNPAMQLRARLPEGGPTDYPERGNDEIYADLAFEDGWRPVRYLAVEKQDHIDRLFAALERLCTEWPSHPDTVGRANALAQVWYNQTVAYLKHEAFVDEREVRLTGNLNRDSRGVKLRAARLGIAPYVEVEVMPHPGMRRPRAAPVREVRIGPGLVDRGAALAGAEYAAKKLGYAIDFVSLESPLR
jgi:hypothetical protein